MATKTKATKATKATKDTAAAAVAKARAARKGRPETISEAILAGHPTVTPGTARTAPEAKPEPTETLSLAEALAESGETIDDLKADSTAPASDKPRSLNAEHWAQYRSRYVKTKVEGEKKARINNGDEIAQKLLTMSLDETYAYTASLTGEAETALRLRYAKLNLGMQRMNLGNKVRAWIKKDAAKAAALEADAKADLEQIPTEVIGMIGY